MKEIHHEYEDIRMASPDGRRILHELTVSAIEEGLDGHGVRLVPVFCSEEHRVRELGSRQSVDVEECEWVFGF